MDFAGQLVLKLWRKRRFDKTREEWMWVRWAALELWVVLASNEEWVLRKLDHFNKTVLVVGGGDNHASFFDAAAVVWVELIAVTVTFGNAFLLTVELVAQATLLDMGRVGTQAHGCTLGFDVLLFVLQADNRVSAFWCKLGGVGVFKP